MRGHAVGGRAMACRLDRTCIHIHMHVVCRDRDPDDRPAWDAVSTFAGDGEDANLHSPVYIMHGWQRLPARGCVSTARVTVRVSTRPETTACMLRFPTFRDRSHLCCMVPANLGSARTSNPIFRKEKNILGSWFITQIITRTSMYFELWTGGLCVNGWCYCWREQSR